MRILCKQSLVPQSWQLPEVHVLSCQACGDSTALTLTWRRSNLSFGLVHSHPLYVSINYVERPIADDYLQMVLACLVYNCPGCPLAADAMNAINDGVELYSMQLFEDSPSSVVSGT